MEEIIKLLYESNNEKFNKEAVNLARENKGKINDCLLEELEKINKDIDNKKIDCAPLFFDYAVFLLAEFKEKRLYPVLMKILNKPNISSFDFFGMGVMDRLPHIVAATFDGNFKFINEVIENKKVDDYTRGMLLGTYIFFYSNNIISESNLELYMRKLIKLYNYEEDGIYNNIVDVISNTHLFSMIDEVKDLFNKGVIDPHYNGEFDAFIDDIFNYVDSNEISDIIDTEKEMTKWGRFSDEGSTTNIHEMGKKFVDLVQNEMKENMEAYSKVGRNDPCPCGSGKKYKKCCLEKEKFLLPYQKYIDDSLNEYPKENHNENEVNFYTFYNKEYIEIDKLLYKALKHKCIPRFVKRDKVKEETLDFGYLNKAYDLIKEVLSKNRFKTIEEYDEVVSIHYSLYSFFEKYSTLIINRISLDKKLYLGKLEELINLFYDNFEINDESEIVFLDRKSALYKLANRYEEGIKFFEDKLKTIKHNRYDIYEYLFYEYVKYYDYDEAIKKMEEAIENEKDEDLKEYLEEMRLDYMYDDEDEEY